MQASSVRTCVRARVSARVTLGALFGGVMVTTVNFRSLIMQNISWQRLFPRQRLLLSTSTTTFRFVSFLPFLLPT